MSLREERNPPPPPVPLTLEEATAEIDLLKKHTHRPLWLALGIVVLIFGLNSGFNRPKAIVEKHPNAIDSLRVDVTVLQDSIKVLKAQGVPAVLLQIKAETSEEARLSEETRVLVVQLEERLNRHELK